jgi:hypothetical protein
MPWRVLMLCHRLFAYERLAAEVQVCFQRILVLGRLSSQARAPVQPGSKSTSTEQHLKFDFELLGCVYLGFPTICRSTTYMQLPLPARN